MLTQLGPDSVDLSEARRAIHSPGPNKSVLQRPLLKHFWWQRAHFFKAMCPLGSFLIRSETISLQLFTHLLVPTSQYCVGGASSQD